MFAKHAGFPTFQVLNGTPHSVVYWSGVKHTVQAKYLLIWFVHGYVVMQSTCTGRLQAEMQHLTGRSKAQEQAVLKLQQTVASQEADKDIMQATIARLNARYGSSFRFVRLLHFRLCRMHSGTVTS